MKINKSVSIASIAVISLLFATQGRAGVVNTVIFKNQSSLPLVISKISTSHTHNFANNCQNTVGADGGTCSVSWETASGHDSSDVGMEVAIAAGSNQEMTFEANSHHQDISENHVDDSGQYNEKLSDHFSYVRNTDHEGNGSVTGTLTISDASD